MSILVTLLVNLLVSFIVMMIKRWLDGNVGPVSVEYLSRGRQEFLDKVKFRFWLGSSRMERAAKAYDLAIARYSNLPLRLVSNPGIKAQEMADAMVEGIAEQL